MKRILFIVPFFLGFLMNSFASESIFTQFVSRDADKLMAESGELRFISFNVPCLHYCEDNVPFTQTNPWRLPDEFEITDALESVRQMGGTVVRIYTLSVRIQGEDPNIPRHIIGPGQFDDKTFESLDMVLAVANRKGVRVIFPFIDNWKWWGGIPACAAFRGKEANDFWTDPVLFEDYKKIVDFVINRTNSVTGVKYRDDKAVLAWETGNELTCPHEWSAKAAQYIKSVDKNHLVIDGYHTMSVREESVSDKNIDIVTTHFYPVMFRLPVTPAVMINHIKENAALARGKKPYFVGEFGFISTKDVNWLLQTVIDEKISGALIWSLRYHNRDGGFYFHSEPHGGDIYKAYHWPGFTSGDAYDETNCLALLRQKAFEIRGLPIPPIEKPAAPILLNKDAPLISWQGSPGASGYNIERAESKEGPGSTSSPPNGWQVVGTNISDADVQYRPLINDTGVEIGKSYYYRVIAQNASGVSEPSNVVGPVSVSCKTLVDEMQNFKLIDKRIGKLSLETKEARKFKEDAHRLKGEKGSFVIYKVEPPIKSFTVYSFFPDNISDFKFYTSVDGQNFKPVQYSRQDYFSGKGDYSYNSPVLFTGAADGNARYLKIEFQTDAQISRVEIRYGKLTAETAEKTKKR